MKHNCSLCLDKGFVRNGRGTLSKCPACNGIPSNPIIAKQLETRGEAEISPVAVIKKRKTQKL